MKKIFLTVIILLIINSLIGQYLYPEKFKGCNTNNFCLDCGDTKAEPPKSFSRELVLNFNSKSLEKIKGNIEVQILIDTLGNPCLLSAQNNTNIKSKKLKLQYSINNTSKWKPAISEGLSCYSSVSLLISFKAGKILVKRISFDFKNKSNEQSIGVPEIEGTDQSKLSDSFTLFTQKNSDLPWDMSRVALAANDAVWIGTDNGLVKIVDDNMTIFNVKNSPIKPEKYNKNIMSALRHAAVDKDNNLWIIAGWEAYKYDGKEWSIYDSTNSPVHWAREVFIDNSNNVWFTSWVGILKFDGNDWTIIDTSNSKIPSNKTSGVFVDSKNRLWIGTYDGNIRIEGNDTIEFNYSDSPLKYSSITQMYEDKKGNLWFDLYNEEDPSKAGIFVLRSDSIWESIKPKNSKLLKENTINHFLLDEENHILWIALNNVGLIRYEIMNDKWEIYTNQNSNIPSTYVMMITKDAKGIIWAATFAGIIKLNTK